MMNGPGTATLKIIRRTPLRPTSGCYNLPMNTLNAHGNTIPQWVADWRNTIAPALDKPVLAHLDAVLTETARRDPGAFTGVFPCLCMYRGHLLLMRTPKSNTSLRAAIMSAGILRKAEIGGDEYPHSDVAEMLRRAYKGSDADRDAADALTHSVPVTAAKAAELIISSAVMRSQKPRHVWIAVGVCAMFVLMSMLWMGDAGFLTRFLYATTFTVTPVIALFHLRKKMAYRKAATQEAKGMIGLLVNRRETGQNAPPLQATLQT